MITLKLSAYTPEEKQMLLDLLVHIQHDMLHCLSECDSCRWRHICDDIDSVLPYIDDQIKRKSKCLPIL